MPALLIPIHVPPLGSLGQSTVSPRDGGHAGGNAGTREISSSRFIARTNPSSRGRKLTLHMIDSYSAKGQYP